MTIKELYLNKNHFAAKKVGNELIIVPLKNNVADMNELFTLNEVGSFIWNHIDGKNGEDDIINAIIDEFDVNVITARKDLKEFISRLSDMI